MRLQVFEKQLETKESWNKVLATLSGVLYDESVNGVCQGLVLATYVKGTAFDHASTIIIGYVPSARQTRVARERVGGFILANDTQLRGFMYIDVVCSNYPKLGEAMISRVDEIAANNGLKGVALSSLAHVIGYYRRLGFRNREDCGDENPAITSAFETKALPLIEKYKAHVAKHIWTPEGKDYVNFLMLLIKSDLTKDKKCKSSRNKLEACNENGYVMTKCITTIPRSPPRAVSPKTPTSDRHSASSPAITTSSRITRRRRSSVVQPTRKSVVSVSVTPKRSIPKTPQRFIPDSEIDSVKSTPRRSTRIRTKSRRLISPPSPPSSRRRK